MLGFNCEHHHIGVTTSHQIVARDNHAVAIGAVGAAARFAIGDTNARGRVTSRQQSADQGAAHIAAANKGKQRIHQMLSKVFRASLSRVRPTRPEHRSAESYHRRTLSNRRFEIITGTHR